MSKIDIISNCNSRIGIDLPDLRFSRQWAAKGAKISIDKETLEQMMYDYGVRYMFENGMLLIQEMEVKKELGLEPEDATKPTNIIVLDDAQKKRYMTVLPIHEFKEQMGKLSYEEIQNLADYAIQNELIGSLEKVEIIRKTIGKDIIQTIRLSKADGE